MKFRKKPVVIEADQFHEHLKPWPEGVQRDGCICKGERKEGFCIQTLEGDHIVTDRDWIITGVKGEKYPCREDIFAETYDLVEEEED
jgi:hypothetical protein